MLFLVGHRGVGKTTALKEVEGSVDLDEVIERSHNIPEFMASNGEKKFRELERKTLFELLRLESPKAVSLGAGFELDKFEFPKNSKILWLQRRSDEKGRIFLDRPRLDKEKSPIEEFLDRKPGRDKVYAACAGFKIEVEEGAGGASVFEDLGFSVPIKKISFETHGFYTALKKEELSFINTNIELRTDFFEEKEIIEILNEETGLNYLVAIRTEVTEGFLEELKKLENITVDIPVDFAEKIDLTTFDQKKVFVSEHDFISLDEIKKFNLQGYHVKWAPEVESFEDLIEFHQSIKGMDVSFLPRSVGNLGGRWNWYRQLTFFKNKITFFRFGLNDYLDQPTYYEIINKTAAETLSGAVIGEDVSLSRSPSFHRGFMSQNFKSTYVRVSLFRDEFIMENILFLKSLGLSFLSVTAPFKTDLGTLSGKNISVNTAYLGQGIDLSDGPQVEDTDSKSIDFLAESLKSYANILVWGAGAIGSLIAKKLGPKATLQSIRDYDEAVDYGKDFDALVWAAGSDCFVVPNLKSTPEAIFDIEYKEQSQARAVALLWGCEYISGQEFFRTQALAQQKFWQSCAKSMAKKAVGKV